MAIAEEHAVEEGRVDTAAAGASGEFLGNGLSKVNQAVDRDGVRCNAIIREGHVGGVR